MQIFYPVRITDNVCIQKCLQTDSEQKQLIQRFQHFFNDIFRPQTQGSVAIVM